MPNIATLNGVAEDNIATYNGTTTSAVTSRLGATWQHNIDVEYLCIAGAGAGGAENGGGGGGAGAGAGQCSRAGGEAAPALSLFGPPRLVFGKTR